MFRCVQRLSPAQSKLNFQTVLVRFTSSGNSLKPNVVRDVTETLGSNVAEAKDLPVALQVAIENCSPVGKSDVS